MTECVEDLDTLFEEAWNRIPYCHAGQYTHDLQGSSSDEQRTLCAKDANRQLTEQNVQAEDEAPTKVATEADKGNHLQTARKGSSDTTIASSPHGTENHAFPDSRTDETDVKILCTDVQDLVEIKEEFDVFEVKIESEDDSNDFCAEQHPVLDVTANMSKSVGQHQTTNNDVGTTSRAHSSKANENPDVNGGEPRTPTEEGGEMENAVQGHGNIDGIVTAPSHLNDDHGSIHFYEGLKAYQSRGIYTDVCIDEVRDKVERVIIDGSRYYRCKLCLKTISVLFAAIKHARAHTRGSYFCCDQCGRKFKCKFSYDIHLDLHAQGQWREIPGLSGRQYACSMCNKFFSTNSLLTSHRMTHTEKFPYRCGVCDKAFLESKQRTMHENQHQRVKKKLACPVCGKELSTPESLSSHLKRHKYYKADVDAYQCDKCPESFPSGTKLIAHMRARHPPRHLSETCNKCGSNFSHPSILQQHQLACHAAPKGPRTFQCKVCGKDFGRRNLLYRHTMIHCNGRPFKCRHCNITFRKSDARHRHEVQHHAVDVTENIVTVPSYLNDDHGSIHFYQGLKEYQSRGMYADVCIDEVRDKVEQVEIDRCPYFRCKICFKTISKLIPTIKHARAHARGSQCFCGQCGRKFKCKFSYDIHLELHAQGQWREIAGPGNRLYTCSMCHKFFPTDALLTSHRTTHTEKFPYRCGVCDKGFREPNRRLMHENTHQRVKKKLACSVCGQEFTYPKSLSSHLKRHKYYKADVDAYQCDKCPEIFQYGTKLTAHMRECHPLRPFSQTCEKCGRSFSLPSTLQQHQRGCPPSRAKRTQDPPLQDVR